MHHSPRLVLFGGSLLAFGAAFANTGDFLEAGAPMIYLNSLIDDPERHETFSRWADREMAVPSLWAFVSARTH